MWQTIRALLRGAGPTPRKHSPADGTWFTVYDFGSASRAATFVASLQKFVATRRGLELTHASGYPIVKQPAPAFTESRLYLSDDAVAVATAAGIEIPPPSGVLTGAATAGAMLHLGRPDDAF